MKNSVFLGLILISYVILTGEMDATPLISANYVNQKPVIDGRLDEPVWKKATTYSNFMLVNGNLATVQTFISLLYDEKNFYIGYRCLEPDIDNLKMEKRERDKEVWKDDSIDFLIIPEKGIAYHFIVNPSGSKYDEKISYPAKADSSWDGLWKVSTHREKDSWIAEISIPFSDFGLKGVKESEEWKVNFCRSRRTSGSKENSSLYPTGGFQNLEKVLTLTFHKNVPSVKIISWGKGELGKNRVRFAIINLFDFSQRLRAELLLNKRRVAVKDFIIPRQSRMEIILPYKISAGGNYILQLKLSKKEKNKVFYISYPYKFKVKKILEVSLDQSYYYLEEKRGKLQIKVDFSEEELKGASLRVDLYNRKGKEIFTRTVRKVTKKDIILPLKMDNLPAQEYTVVVSLFKDKRLKAKEEVSFGRVPRAKWPRVNVKKVTIGKEGTILVNGKPFFPIGMYHVIPEDYKDIAYLGFNTVMAGWYPVEKIKEQLNAAQSAGLLANVGLSDRGRGTTLGKKENVKTKVLGIKKHPALIFYHLLDEPAVSYYPTLKKGYEFVKSLDSNHLQYCTIHCFWSYPDTIIDKAGETRDIYAPDIYPFDTLPVKVVGEGVRMCVEAAKRTGWKKSVIYVGPCFEWLPIYRLPTPKEVRLVAYLAIINGAKGIEWYSYRESLLEKTKRGYGLHAPEASKLRRFFKRLNSELFFLYKAICAPNPEQFIIVRPENSVDFVLKEDKSSYYLIAANPSKEEKEVTFISKNNKFPKKAITDVFYEYRKVKMENGTFKDRFLPYDVHIYVISKK